MPLEMRKAPLDREDLDMLQIETQQTPTDDLLVERERLRKLIQGPYVGVREPGSGYHPDLATLQIIEAELNRRNGYWPNAVAEKVIERADVPLDGPQVFDLIKRDQSAAPTTDYVEQAALTEKQITEFIRELAETSNAELEELYTHFTSLVGTMEGFVREAAGLHPDLEKLELVEKAKLDRDMRDWTGKTLLRGALVGSVAGTALAYVARRPMAQGAIAGGVASALAARFSWWWRKVIGAAAPPDAAEQSDQEKKETLGAYDYEPYRLGVVGGEHWIGEPRIDPDLYWRR